jgi:5'-nucleotidase
MEVKVLLTNDDGFYAEGLQTLFRYLNQVTEVTIVAPDRERSAVGHGITMNHPLRVTTVTLAESQRRAHWIVDGTPADCVKIALDVLLKEHQPGLVISGLNHGANMGNDVLYSGTVSAALEGSMYRIPAIAASLVDYGQSDFNPAAAFIALNLKQLALAAQNNVLNLNFPKLSDDAMATQIPRSYAGVRYTRLGRRVYENVFEERRDPRGRIYYWMGGEALGCEQQPDSDIFAVEHNFISITPLQSDLTNFEALKSNPGNAETNKFFGFNINNEVTS